MRVPVASSNATCDLIAPLPLPGQDRETNTASTGCALPVVTFLHPVEAKKPSFTVGLLVSPRAAESYAATVTVVTSVNGPFSLRVLTQRSM